MVIEEKIQEAINKQVNREFYSAYLYLSMSAYFESTNLKGFSHWMRVQVKEKAEHAMKLYDYLNERGGKVILSKDQTYKRCLWWIIYA
ncbi:MAG: ferritin-like domain-containing protein [Candidatus Aerophobetes bacterium]|nr:ferritin-like domain-containing protein [Candidatus Aerophobetes bacterium]